MSQTDINAYWPSMPTSKAGQLYELDGNTFDTLLAEAAILFGAPVRQGTAINKGLGVSALTDKIVGVAVWTHARENQQGIGVVNEYKIGSQMSVVRRGRVWVTVAADVTKESAAYVSAAGTFGVTNTDIRVGRYITAATTGNLAVLELSGFPVNP